MYCLTLVRVLCVFVVVFSVVFVFDFVAVVSPCYFLFSYVGLFFSGFLFFPRSSTFYLLCLYLYCCSPHRVTFFLVNVLASLFPVRACFRSGLQAFTKLGFGFEEKCWCYETCAAVLHLGNISFSANGEGSQVSLH